MPRKTAQIPTTNNSGLYLSDEPTVRALCARLAKARPGLTEEEYEAQAAYVILRIQENPFAADYSNPEALFDSSLPQRYGVDFLNVMHETPDRVASLLIDAENARGFLSALLLSDLARAYGLENDQRQILDMEAWTKFFNELASPTEPDYDFQLAASSAWLFFIEHAPKLFGVFVRMLTSASLLAGFKSAVNAPRNAQEVKARRVVEEGAKISLEGQIDDLRALLKTLLELKERGRWEKEVPPEGTPLVIAVETFLMETKPSKSGVLRFPGIDKLLKYVNSRPDLLAQKRKVLKGGHVRRRYTARTLYGQLRADGHPLPVIKARVKANYA